MDQVAQGSFFFFMKLGFLFYFIYEDDPVRCYVSVAVIDMWIGCYPSRVEAEVMLIWTSQIWIIFFLLGNDRYKLFVLFIDLFFEMSVEKRNKM